MKAQASDPAVRREAPWTEEQWDAITARDCDLLVSAAAGAGKTAVLVRRVILRLTDPADPVDIDRMLVVTFTDAAAAEMRERIASALAGRLAADPGDARLARQIALVNKADVSTLHSFCHKVVRQYFYRLGLDPTFRVMDELEADLLRLEVADDVFERSYGEPEFEEAFTALVDRYGGPAGDDALKGIVLGLYRYSRSRPAPGRWFAEIRSAFDIPRGTGINDLSWTRVVLGGISRQLALARRRLAEATEVASSAGGPVAYIDTLQREIASCSAVLEACRSGDWDRVAGALAGFDFQKLPAARSAGSDAGLKERAKDLRGEARRLVEGIRDVHFARPAEELVDDVRALAPHMDTLVRVVEEFGKAYDDAKRARNVLDFSDLEHLCLEVLARPGEGRADLVPSDVGVELARRYREILVDEYQDVNPVQDAILRLVSRKRASFMVGDVKQSIYRFRLAEPGLFMRKYRGFSKAASDPFRRIDLSSNFRSRRQVIDAVNFLFRQLFVGGASEIEYDEDAELVCGADYPAEPPGFPPASSVEPAVEVHIVERKAANALAETGAAPQVTAAGVPGGSELVDSIEHGGPGEEAGEGDVADDSGEDAREGDRPRGGSPAPEELEALEAEGRLIASRIREMVGGTDLRPGPELSVWDRETKAYRPVSYRDIVVLMRATRERANVLLEVFRRADIPAYAELGTGYFQATEIETMVSLLRVIDNPRQDIPLAAVLRSPICGLSVDDLAQVRLCRQDADYYDALKACLSRADLGELVEKAGRFLQRLERWRTLARRLPLSILIWELYRDTRYLDYVGGTPGGAQRQANLRALHERARQFDRFSRHGLFRFVRFVDELLEAEGDLGTARVLGEAEDVVRVMSIHKSKGLEFPVVFVADLGKDFNLQDLKGDVLFHSETGLGAMFCDPVRRVKYPTLAYHAVRERRRAEAIAEEMRILYVALTRAKEKLVLVGSAVGLAKRARGWCEEASRPGWGLPEDCLFSATSFLDWLASAIARHASGLAIRELGLFAGEPGNARAWADPARFEVRIWDLARIPGEWRARAEEPSEDARVPLDRIALAEPIGRKIDPETRLAIEEHLGWTYRWRPLAGRAAKATWPELKRRFDPGADDHDNAELTAGEAAPVWPAFAPLRDRPDFMQAVEITAAERGQATHLVIQHLDLARPHSTKDIRSAMDDMTASDLLTPELARSVDARAIAGFLESPLGRRMTSHPLSVRREVPFCLGMSMTELYPEVPPDVAGGDRVVVQGIIDCLIDEPDGFVLIDFKTDARARYDAAAAASAYQGQIRLYAAAVEAIYGRPVKEAHLYFLSAGLAVRVDTHAG